MTVTNTAALASPVYNPGYDSTDLAIYNIMNNDSTDETNTALTKQYTNSFYNMSTTNPYEGVLQNPLTCDISDIGSSISGITDNLQNVFGNTTAFDPSNPPSETSSDYQNYVDWDTYINPSNENSTYSMLTGGTPTTTTYTQDQVLDIPSNATIATGSDGSYSVTTYTNPNSIQQSLSNAQTHTDRLLSNLPSIISLAQAAIGIATALEALANPCLGLSNFFGSLSGTGSKLIAGVKDAISKLESYIKTAMSYIDQGIDYVKSQIKAVMDEINSAIQSAMSYITSLVSQIESEIKNLIKSMLSSIKMGISGFLKGLLNDACLSSLTKTLGTSALQFAL